MSGRRAPAAAEKSFSWAQGQADDRQPENPPRIRQHPDPANRLICTSGNRPQRATPRKARESVVESPQEQRLLSEIRIGRRDACAEVVRAHYAAVYRFCAHLSRNTAAAEDLTQDTFARAWARIGDFRGESSFSTWLHRIAYCGWLDGRRRAARGQAALDRLTHERAEPISESFAPLQGLIVEEETKQLYAAVQRLTESHRVVVVLHYLQGLSYQEMAAVLAEPTGTVKARTRRALEQLRGFLSPEASHERTRGIEGVGGVGGPASRPAATDGAAGS